ncbi:MAG: KUP/HAK/KT family potassium transporter [Bacteroidetes bacterium]|nr:KUP/HAK/KT family potassium transporter [Bacteroidota bacterium]
MISCPNGFTIWCVLTLCYHHCLTGTITGCFTLVNEAKKLRLLPNLKVNYPTMQRGQIYIPFINWVLLAVVLRWC